MPINISHNPDVQLSDFLRDAGFPAVQPPVSQTTVPNAAQWPVQHYQTFSSIFNSYNHSYRYTFDEAMRESPQNARIMRRDPVLMDALRARQIPTCQLEYHLEPQDNTDPQQMWACANLTSIINSTPRFQWLKMHLLEAIWFGRYGVQQIFKWNYDKKFRRMMVGEHRPMMGDKMVFKWSGDVGVLVHSAFKGDIEMSDRGLCHFFTPAEREAIILHRFEPEDKDFYEPDEGGAVQGLGVRGRLYWFWYLKSKMLQYYLDFMQRIGLGIDVFYYEAGNPDSLAEMRMAAANTMGNLRLLLPRFKDGTGPGYQHFEADLTGARMFTEFLSGYFDQIMRQYILGQTLTTIADATGMGSGVAEAHQATQEMIIQYDATALAETLTVDWLRVLSRWNHPGVPCPKFVFDVEKPNVAEYMQAAQMLYEMGVTVDADDLRSVTGMPRPEAGHDIISKFQQNQAATVGVPQGTPVMSEADQQGQQQQADQAQQQQQQDPTQQQGQAGQVAQQYRRRLYDFTGNMNHKTMIRPSKLNKAMDTLLSLRNNRDNRRSWSTV